MGFPLWKPMSFPLCPVHSLFITRGSPVVICFLLLPGGPLQKYFLLKFSLGLTLKFLYLKLTHSKLFSTQ